MSLKNEFLDLKNAEIQLYPNFLPAVQANAYFEKLYQELDWQQDNIKLFGKTFLQPRLTALYGNNNEKYTYSGISMFPKPFPPALLELKNKIEAVVEENFSSCLANLYRNGQDSNSWHADDEKELGPQPIIASLSLGTTRFFHLKNKNDPNIKTKIPLSAGSLLLMKGGTQENYKHQVPKTKKEVGPRINLTFRKIKNL